MPDPISLQGVRIPGDRAAEFEDLCNRTGYPKNRLARELILAGLANPPQYILDTIKLQAQRTQELATK